MIGKMEKKLYVAPELDVLDAELDNILLESGGNGKDDEKTDVSDARAWGGEWFDSDDYVEE